PGVLRDAGSAPAINCFNVLQLTQALPQHGLGGVLRQPFVVGEIIGPHQLTLEPVIPVAAQQRAVGRHAADAVVGRDRSRRSKLRLRAPEVKVLEGALSQVLTLRDRLRADVALDQNAADAALAEVDRKTKTYRPASDNDDLRGCFGGHVHFGFLRLADWRAGGENENTPASSQEKSHIIRFCLGSPNRPLCRNLLCYAPDLG